MLFLRYYLARAHLNALGIAGLVVSAVGLVGVVNFYGRNRLSIGLAVVGLAAFVPGLLETLRLVRVVKTGVPVRATVESVSASRATASRKSSRHTLIVFTWVDSAGATQRGSLSLDGAPVRWPRVTENPVVVLDPQRPTEPVFDLFGVRASELR